MHNSTHSTLLAATSVEKMTTCKSVESYLSRTTSNFLLSQHLKLTTTSLSRKDIDMAGIGAGCTFLYSEGITQYAYSSVTLSDSLIRTPASIAYSSDACVT